MGCSRRIVEYSAQLRPDKYRIFIVTARRYSTGRYLTIFVSVSSRDASDPMTPHPAIPELQPWIARNRTPQFLWLGESGGGLLVFHTTHPEIALLREPSPEDLEIHSRRPLNNTVRAMVLRDT